MIGGIGDDDEEAKKLLRTRFRVCAAVGEKSERAALAAARMLFGGLWETIKFMNRPGIGLGREKPIEKAELSDDDLEVLLNWIGAIEAGVYV